MTDWRLDAATEDQIDDLRSFGIEVKPELTRGEASDLLYKATKDPMAFQRQLEQEIKFPSYFLRRAIQRARQELEESRQEKAERRSELTALAKQLAAAEKKRELDLLNDGLTDEVQAIKSEIEATKSAFDGVPDNLKDAQDELKDQTSRRSNFWKATFSKYGAVSVDNADLIDYSETIDRLHDEFGRFFKSPTNKQIAEILEALDRASVDWDRKEPHAFYATLKASFPDALRKNPARSTMQPTKTGTGCLLIAGLILPALGVLIVVLARHY
jgi:chromosome segregation ATPase